MIESPLLVNLLGYIDGHWRQADSGNRMPVINPASRELLAEVPHMGRDETTRAVEAAERALHLPATISRRRDWLTGVADKLVEQRDELARIITLENGKPINESRGEVNYSVGFFRFYARHVTRLRSRTLKEQPREHQWTIHYKPSGVAGLITPWNFPLAMIVKKLSASMAADCPCVIKPAEQTPLSTIALLTLLEQVGVPPGKVNLVMGAPSEIGGVLCEHPEVRSISFTGSTEIGKLLSLRAANHIKRLALELGGNAPFIVFEDADLDLAVDHLMQNKFRAAGQTCVCTNRVYVQRGVAEAFTKSVAQRVAQLKSGDGMLENTDIGPLIDRAAFDKVKAHVDDAMVRGARCVTGGPPHGPIHDGGFFFPPTVLRGVCEQARCVREETFGPVVPILEFDHEDDVIARANGTEYGLAAYLFTRNDRRARRVVAALRFGHVGRNSGTGPTPEAPFGGMKHSGFGREGGWEGLMEFVEPQTEATQR
jgi:succinate-semialdehyde dehydrogenase/glutarate-semialdehyde dehydrogenase